jgi:hypothetical protein
VGLWEFYTPAVRNLYRATVLSLPRLPPSALFCHDPHLSDQTQVPRGLTVGAAVTASADGSRTPGRSIRAARVRTGSARNGGRSARTGTG